MSGELQKLYVQCNPLLDISAKVEDEFLAKYKVQRGSASLVSEEQMGIYADLESQPGVVYIPGGSGLNTARVAQWVLRTHKGEFVSYVGCISDDKYGKILKDAAEKDGVQMNVEYTTAAVTGTCGVCVTGKERALIANLAAANCLSAAHFDSPAVVAALASSKLFYLTGFTLTVDVNYVLKVAQNAHAVGGKFMMNLSAPFIIQFFGEQLAKVLPYVDVLFGNYDEAIVLSKTHNWDTEDLVEITRRASHDLPYSGSGERLVVFTNGANPTQFVSKSSSGTVPVPPIALDDIVDLNGAGDAFVGGFLAAYAVGRTIQRCCEAGHYAAGVIIQHDGCTYPESPSFTL